MSVKYPEIIKEKDFSQKISYINSQLCEIKTSKRIFVTEKVSLYLEEYINPNANANIIILHGFSEFCQKYRETVWYFYNLGFNVFVYDQRDHGFSCRAVQDSQLLNVENFEDYSTDLEFIINNEISVLAPNLKLYIFSHSMGGAVALYYCLKHPDKIEKLVLSSPLVALKTMNIPRFAVLFLAKLSAKNNGVYSAFPFQRSFDPNVRFCDSADMSEARFNEYLKLRIENPQYQPSIATNNWMFEALKVSKRLLKENDISKIKTKVIMFVAESENTVKKSLQKKLAKKLNGCRFEMLKNTKHNIFSSEDSVLERYYTAIFDFFCENG